MNTITLESLTEKLKYVPDSILEKIWEYADTLIKNKEYNFSLSEEQKRYLLDQDNVPLNQCVDANEVYQQLKNKYEL